MKYNKENVCEKMPDGQLKVHACVGDYGFAADSISLMRSVIEGGSDFDCARNYGRLLTIDYTVEYPFLVKCLDGYKLWFKYFYICDDISLCGDIVFRLSNVVYSLSDGSYTQDVEVGDEGWFGPDLGSLRQAVETGDNERCCYGKLTDIRDDVYPFECDNLFVLPLFYPVRRNCTPKYRPYNWDEVTSLCGKWAKYKNKDEMFELIRFVKLDDDVITVNGMDMKTFLASCVWLDGTPCGVPLRE